MSVVPAVSALWNFRKAVGMPRLGIEEPNLHPVSWRADTSPKDSPALRSRLRGLELHLHDFNKENSPKTASWVLRGHDAIDRFLTEAGQNIDALPTLKQQGQYSFESNPVLLGSYGALPLGYYSGISDGVALFLSSYVIPAANAVLAVARDYNFRNPNLLRDIRDGVNNSEPFAFSFNTKLSRSALHQMSSGKDLEETGHTQAMTQFLSWPIKRGISIGLNDSEIFAQDEAAVDVFHYQENSEPVLTVIVRTHPTKPTFRGGGRRRFKDAWEEFRATLKPQPTPTPKPIPIPVRD